MNKKNVWEIIWDYDPNALLVIDDSYNINVINSAFTRYFNLEKEDIIGRKVSDFFDDIEDFVKVNIGEEESITRIKTYEKEDLIMSEVIFKIEEENLVVKIFNDISTEIRKESKLKEFKLQILEEVQKIVDKQMKTGQEIASILGETTAETKSSLIKLMRVLKQEER